MLQNITMKPAIFAVLVEVPKGWSVDSDPQPTEIEGDVAIFRVHAEVGETVRLHVGVRRTKDLKPKPLGGGRAADGAGVRPTVIYVTCEVTAGLLTIESS